MDNPNDVLMRLEGLLHDYGLHMGYAVGLAPGQALILLRIGDDPVIPKQLASIYSGTNITYNVKGLVAIGALASQPTVGDRRSVSLSLTDTGKRLRAMIAKAHERFLAEHPALRSLLAIAAQAHRLAA